jgi:hypothetical protein
MNWLSRAPVSVSTKNIRPVWPTPLVTVGQPLPNDSSMKFTILPSHVNVAEWWKSMFG